jgi:hypothetical protein
MSGWLWGRPGPHNIASMNVSVGHPQHATFYCRLWEISWTLLPFTVYLLLLLHGAE